MPFLASHQVIVPFDEAAAMHFRAARHITQMMGGELPEPAFLRGTR